MQIEQEVRQKYTHGSGKPADLIEEAVQELVALRTEYEELYRKLLFARPLTNTYLGGSHFYKLLRLSNHFDRVVLSNLII